MARIEFDRASWNGRVDREDPELSLRIHQIVQDAALHASFESKPVLLGFACDEGVRRNLGRTGAVKGPDAIRFGLSSLTQQGNQQLFDAGNVEIDGQDLEQCQLDLAKAVHQILAKKGFPMVMGGGHEIAWGSYQGLRKYYKTERIGIINFDAHFDLRNPAPVSSSGTPFREIAEWNEQHQLPFDYFVVGLNPASNSNALFNYAKEKSVGWVEDINCNSNELEAIFNQIKPFIDKLDLLYLTNCIDVFSSGDAPGVSAPAAMGIEKHFSFSLMKKIVQYAGKKLVLVDVAEVNPSLDSQGLTARLAARWLWEIANTIES